MSKIVRDELYSPGQCTLVRLKYLVILRNETVTLSLIHSQSSRVRGKGGKAYNLQRC